jgi:hypothetical protein
VTQGYVANPCCESRRCRSIPGDTRAACVEIADLPNGARAVRDSKNPDGGHLMFTATEWSAFTADAAHRPVRLTARREDQRHGLRKPNTRPVPLATRPLTRQPSVRYIACR